VKTQNNVLEHARFLHCAELSVIEKQIWLGQAAFQLELDCNYVITGSNPVGTSIFSIDKLQ
jgi:hypothetical protein